MNRKSFVIGFLMLIALSVQSFAQVSVDPNDNFYASAKEWQIKGIVSFLPQLRPYPVSTVKQILEQVIQNGSEKDKTLADEYYKKYFGKGWNVALEASGKVKIDDSKKITKMLGLEPLFYGDIEFLKYVSIGYKLGVLFQNKSTTESDTLPFAKNALYDTYDDPATFGPVVGNLDMVTNATVGISNLYGMIGVNRVGYGPFVNDGVILNSTAYHAGNFSFTYNAEKWAYSQLISAVSAGRNFGITGTSEYEPNKFIAFHTLRFTPIKQLSLAYFESSVFGQRFDATYFIPVPYMIIQGMFGQCDNTLAGLTVEYRPIDKLELDLSGAFDDVNINGFASGNMNSRLRMALQVGASYTPDSAFCDLISADYTIVTPYNYSHAPSDSNPTNTTNNYFSYTNRDISVGSSIPPNSDKIQVNAKFRPVKHLLLEVQTSFTRHANALESLSDDEAQKLCDDIKNGTSYNSDGSVMSYPYPDIATSDLTNFLNQAHTMYVLQAGFNSEYEFERTKAGAFSIKFGYMFEYIHNKGVDKPIYTKDSIDKDSAKKLWVDNLHNEFNNYFTASVKYSY